MTAWWENTQARQLTDLYRALRLYVNCCRALDKTPVETALREESALRLRPSQDSPPTLAPVGVLPAQKQQELLEVAHALDPIRLFQQLEQLQQAVFRCATSCSPFVPSLSSAPLRVFSVERSSAANFPDERSVPNPVVFHTLYHEQERRRRVLGWWRTHNDLFEGEWEQILSWLVANPERSSGDIFRELQRHTPGRYQPLQICTLQRGMRKIRAHLLETFEEQWQDEVIHGPSPSPKSPTESTARSS